MSINQVHLLGRCGQDPEIRTIGQNNVSKASFSLCTGGKYKTQDGREIDDTAWHNIVAWRGLASLAQQYIRKGTQLFIIGHLSYRRYTDSNGSRCKKPSQDQQWCIPYRFWCRMRIPLRSPLRPAYHHRWCTR